MSEDNNIPEIVDIEPVEDAGPASGSHSSSGPHSSGAPSRPARSGSASRPSSKSSSSSQDSDDPLIGLTLKGTYRLVKKIGEGGMGNVYKALQSPLEREVAVKLLKPTENNPEGEHYFMREVKAINMLRHPNIIGILDFGKEPDGTLYLVMEYLPGRTLKRTVRKEFPLDPVRICGVCIQVLSALEQAHQSGVIHCDLKPANIMIERVAGEDDFVKVLDFGIAKVKGPAMEVGPYTQAGNIVGTFDYMSPEQIMRKDLDGRADIWSLGVIMYEMLTRKRIFHDKDAVSIIGRVMQMPIKKPTDVLDPKYNYEIPQLLEDVVMKAMERNIDNRFQSAAEMRDVLKQVRARLEEGDGDRTMPPQHEDSGVGSSSLGQSGPLSQSALVRDQSGNLVPSQNLDSSTGRTGLSAIYTRSGSFGGIQDSQKLATGIAAGTSVLDQTFSIEELEDSLMGERRKVAVLAVQQRSRGKKGLDPEELARRSAAEVAVIRQVIENYDGEIDSFLGGTYTVLFGAKKARIGDNIRAIECATALQKRFQSLEHGHEHLGIGLSYGEIYLASRKGGNAFGGAIDRAIEVARGAKNADVLVDGALIEVTSEQVEFEPTRNVGGEPAAKVVQIAPGAAISKESPVQGAADIYVPRPGYFGELTRRASDAKQGNGGGVAILGDLGTGKSTLLKHFVADLDEAKWQTFLVRNNDRANKQGLSTVRAWIRNIALTYKDPHTLVRKACESIGLAEGVDAVVEFYMNPAGADHELAARLPWQDASSFAYFTAALIQRMVRFAMKKGPVCLAVDDIDVWDATELDVIDNLIASVQKHPVMVAGSLRFSSTERDHGLPGNFEVLQIGAFSENEARQCIAQTLGYSPPQDVNEHLMARSERNPMYLAELLRALARDEMTQMLSAEAIQNAIPQSLHELLAQRVDSLSTSVKDVLAIASVLGESFREELLYQIAPAHLGPKIAVGELVGSGLMEAGLDAFERIVVAFKPRVLRKIVYERLPRDSRHQFHSRVIEFLEQAPEVAAVDPVEWPAMLAFHYRAVEGWEGAAHYMMRAGDMLLDLYDYPSAISQYQEARDLLDENGFELSNATYAAVIARLLVSLRESGRLDDAQAQIETLPSLDMVPPEYRAPILLERGRVGMDSAEVDAAFRALETVRDIAIASQNSKLEIQAMLGIAKIFEKQNQLSNAGGVLMEVSKKVEGVQDINLQDPEDRKLYWTAYNQLGTLLIRQQNFPQAQQYLNTALRRAQEIHDHRGLIRVLSNLGALCLSMRDIGTAKEYFGRALQFAQGTGDLLNQARILTNLGVACMESNDLEGSKRYFKQARDIGEDIGWHEGLADLSLHIRKLKAALGNA